MGAIYMIAADLGIGVQWVVVRQNDPQYNDGQVISSDPLLGGAEPRARRIRVEINLAG